MNKNIAIIITVVALVVGLGVGYIVGVKDSKEEMHKMPNGSKMSNNASHNMPSSMDGMMTGLEDKTGDEFDMAFITEMIAHHEGAVAMAQMALQNAKHPEIKQLSENIISAQNSEISQMRTWLKAWYGNEASVNSNNSGSSGGAVHDMDMMGQ